MEGLADKTKTDSSKQLKLTWESFSGQEETSTIVGEDSGIVSKNLVEIRVIPYKRTSIDDAEGSRSSSQDSRGRNHSDASSQTENLACRPTKLIGSSLNPKQQALQQEVRESAHPSHEMFSSNIIDTELAALLRRSPSNKQPFKVFASQTASDTCACKPIGKQPTIKGGSGKFMFPGLVIDVEEANRQQVHLPDPPKFSRKDGPPPAPSHQADANAIDIMKQFYQDQVDRLNERNEQLLRENERLRLELKHSKQECVGNASLRRELNFMRLKHGEGINQMSC